MLLVPARSLFLSSISVLLRILSSGQDEKGPGHFNHYKFNGKERDAETGLDFFEVRHYASGMGRFMQPDPGPWRLLNPQSFNAYAYGLNNPIRYADSTGLTAEDRVNEANKLAGEDIPYVSGGGHTAKSDPADGLDCSGLAQTVLRADPDNNINVNGDNAAQIGSALQANGEFSTSISGVKAGDAIFWSSGGGITHVGIVVSARNGVVYFVHAPHPGANVHKASVPMNNPKLGSKSFAGVGRPREAAGASQATPGASGSSGKAGGHGGTGFIQWLFDLFTENKVNPDASVTSSWTVPNPPKATDAPAAQCDPQGAGNCTAPH